MKSYVAYNNNCPLNVHFCFNYLHSVNAVEENISTSYMIRWSIMHTDVPDFQNNNFA
jgi:hypothetical protein